MSKQFGADRESWPYTETKPPSRTGLDPNFDVGFRPWRLRTVSLFVTSDRPGDELRRYPTLAVGNPIELAARSVTTIVAEFDTGRE
jgi:hypothetical protein